MYVEISNVTKSYGEGGSYCKVLNGISTLIDRGQICVILGPSGSGKSTLLNAIGGLDTVDSGQIHIDGKEITGLKPERLSDYRRDTLGFVFQFYNLIPNLTAEENIQVCGYLSKVPLSMQELLDILGLTEHRNKFPSQLFKLASVGCHCDCLCMENMTFHFIHIKSHGSHSLSVSGKDFKNIYAVQHTHAQLQSFSSQPLNGPQFDSEATTLTFRMYQYFREPSS